MSADDKPFDDEPFDDGDIVGVDEFADYGPIFGCMVVPAFGVALLLSWVIKLLAAPAWATSVLAMIYLTLPCAAFTWWTRQNRAIRLRDGRVLSARTARRLALTAWIAALAFLILRYAIW